MAGSMSDEDMEYSEAVELATKIMRAGDALEDFVDYAEKNDFDIGGLDVNEIDDLEYEEYIILYAFSGFARSLSKASDMIEDDDDDDNPFKVSDGDDPVY